MDVTELTSAALHFDPEKHEYRLPDGQLVPNVTTILKETGVATDFDEIASRSAALADAITYRRYLGVAAHADCHAFDDDDLDWSSMHADVKPYVQAWAEFRQNSGLVPVARERIVFHPAFFYCGTLDGIFRRRDSARLVLGDIKIGDPHAAAAHLQTAMYAEAWATEHPEEKHLERWAIRLIPGRRIPYEITKYADWTDHMKFRAVLTVFNEQPARRRKVA